MALDKLKKLKEEVQKYQYFENTDIIDISIASVVATRLKLGDPIWLIIIGPSSGGKSQLVRPISLTDPLFIHRVDDITENTFLSAAAGGDKSLLNRIGEHGMIVISDLTVIFSKSSESRATILSQFRMIYDGEMIKHSGNKDEPTAWKGYMGILAASTPSIYAGFEEAADMGERFIFYRMKPFNADKATKVSMNRGVYGRQLDQELSELYKQYIYEAVTFYLSIGRPPIELSEECNNRILVLANFAERIRTVQHTDWRGTANRIPVPAMPMRVALQLTTMAKALAVITIYENQGGNGGLSDEQITMIEWCGYSLANEEKRACLKVLAKNNFEYTLNTSTIADHVGLSTEIIRTSLQNLAAVGVLERTGIGDALHWKFKNESEWALVRRLEGIEGDGNQVEVRDSSNEEEGEKDEEAEQAFTNF